MHRSAFVKATENNLFEAWEFISRLPQVDYFRSPEMIRFISGVPFPLCNGIMGVNFPGEGLDRRIREALAPIKSRGLPMFWWLGPGTSPGDLAIRLEKEGLVLVQQIPGMAMDLETFEDGLPDLPGLEIREVDNPSTLDAWIEVFRTGFEIPEFVADFFRKAMIHAGFAPDSPYGHFLGLWEGTPAACSSVYLGRGAAGLYNVATLPALRGRGIGAAMTRWPLGLAKEKGFRIGILHSTSMGMPVYEKIGFQEYCRLTLYHWQP